MSSLSLATEISAAGDTRVAADPPFNISASWLPPARSPGESSQESKLSPARVPPDDSAIGRLKAVGLIDYGHYRVECLLPWPQALGFDWASFRRHRQRHKIVMRIAAYDLSERGGSPFG